MNKFDFTARNGDKLTPLNERLEEANNCLATRRAALAQARANLRPIEIAVEEAERERDNISTRLNIWWNEYRSRHFK